MTAGNLAAGIVGLPVWEFTLAVALGAPIRAAVFSILGTAALSLSLVESVTIGVGLVSVFILPLLVPPVRGWVFGVDTLDREE